MTVDQDDPPPGPGFPPPGQPGPGQPGPGYPGHAYPGPGYPGPGYPVPPPAVAEAPAPPRGPGVRPPFVAPPTDGARHRRGMAAVLAIVAAIVCCLGGIAGVVGVVVLGDRAVDEMARTTVADFYQGIMDAKYPSAYRLLCDGERQRSVSSLRKFKDLVEDGPEIVGYEVGELQIPDLETLTIGVRLEFKGSDPRQVKLNLAQDMDTGEFRICGRWL